MTSDPRKRALVIASVLTAVAICGVFFPSRKEQDYSNGVSVASDYAHAHRQVGILLQKSTDEMRAALRR